MTEQQQAERLVRLRWACRRTLQALDRPLGNFLQDCFQTLDMEKCASTMTTTPEDNP